MNITKVYNQVCYRLYMVRPHYIEGLRTDHYPCEVCELENLREDIEHNGLAWAVNNLKGQLFIDRLLEFKKIIDDAVKLEVKKRDGKLQSNEPTKPTVVKRS